MNIAIIPAAGSGLRMGGSVAKQFMVVAGAPVLIHTMRRFEECAAIDAMIVALQASEIEPFQRSLPSFGFRKPIRIVSGGRERSDSIFNALEAAREFSPELVAVHDAVRPFVTAEQITRVLEKARETGAAILALPVSDTIKEVEDGVIVRTIDRSRIWRAQTPQVFRFELLARANAEARTTGLASALTTDDALLVERIGEKISVVEGSPNNLKITTPEDLDLAEILFAESGSSANQTA
jgi:2-C-methyl-D-erythritol 4-phosphate cytidylyltransferase